MEEGEVGTINSEDLYFIQEVDYSLLKIFVNELGGRSLNYIQLDISYGYEDKDGEEMTQVMPSVLLDMDSLIELGAIINRSMVRLEDAITLDLEAAGATSEPGDEETWDWNAGEPLD